MERRAYGANVQFTFRIAGPTPLGRPDRARASAQRKPTSREGRPASAAAHRRATPTWGTTPELAGDPTGKAAFSPDLVTNFGMAVPTTEPRDQTAAHESGGVDEMVGRAELVDLTAARGSSDKAELPRERI